ncbi:MAG: 1-deoxy-D-xylulose-5-phosphate reductoisomerase, partial [Acidobacteriota bacterium]|nr:1-deoxy-D-xylulose-5-phosphate reductoisomerase [Acidobacteriota bacterium]
MKNLAILGSTGSIGRSCLQVVDANPDAFRVLAIAAGWSLERLADQVERYRPDLVCVAEEAAAADLESRFGAGTRVVHGDDGLIEVARHDGADLVVCGLVGAVGLMPT